MSKDSHNEKSFSDLGLFPWIAEQCTAMGITKPTPVQQHCIPPIMSGKNCIAVSQTGTGKTLAFALPLLHVLTSESSSMFALILTPTRELACQISEQITVVGKPMGVQVCLVIGGVNQVTQGGDISKHPQIVVATPGRLADLFKCSYDVYFKRIKLLVLDEADRLFNGQFNEQLQTIIKPLPAKKQTLIFSATLSEHVEIAIKHATTDPFIWKAEAETSTVENLKQHYVLIPNEIVLNANLVQLISDFQENHEYSSMIIFTKNGNVCRTVSMALTSLGIENVALNSLLKQHDRRASIAKFKSNRVRVLVATDLASRGLDIPMVDLVVNFNVPPVPTDYVHRVGRTARAGRGGCAVTFVTPRQVKRLLNVEKLINCKLTEFKIPEQKVLKIALQVEVAFREAAVSLEDDETSEKKQIYKRKQEILDNSNANEVSSQKKKSKKKHKNKNTEKQSKNES